MHKDEHETNISEVAFVILIMLSLLSLLLSSLLCVYCVCCVGVGVVVTVPVGFILLIVFVKMYQWLSHHL